ncbi:MAG: YCF48-related protein [Zavarzinella sp.]
MRAALFVVTLCTAVSYGEMKDHMPDAGIRAVYFVDHQEGWVAGDDGLIMHTINGGATWEKQVSGSRSTITSICFLSPYTGWAAGRTELPGGKSEGTILFTSDGGLNWTNISKTGLPGINRVQFFDARNGIAAGDGTPEMPSGLFSTIDGGVTWKTRPGVLNPSWLAADFTDADTGVLAGVWNRLAPVRDGRMGVADVDSLHGKNIEDVKVRGQLAVAVGQGASILLSSNTAGVRWGMVDLQLPRMLKNSIDFSAVSVVSNEIWVVGRPGSVLFHSKDAGKTWEILPTGQNLPLYAIHFVDSKRGWATGALGIILATTDGGKNWTVQHRGGNQSALMAISARPENLPWELMTALGAEEGYLVNSLSIFHADPPILSSRFASDAERIAAAMKSGNPKRALDRFRATCSVRQTGGASAEQLWQFPLPTFQNVDQTTQIVINEALAENSSVESLVFRLVVAFRIWRPEVVVIDQEMAQNEMVHQAITEAFKQVSESKYEAELLQQVKLAPWSPKKLFVERIAAKQGTARIDTTRILDQVSNSASVHAFPTRQLWEEETKVDSVLCYELTHSRLGENLGKSSFFEGIPLSEGGIARRRLSVPAKNLSTDSVARKNALERERVFQHVIQKPSRLATGEQVLAQIMANTEKLPPHDAGMAMYRAGQGYAKLGQWELAKEVYRTMVLTYPGHPMTLQAAHWLILYSGSSEARRRYELGQFATVTSLQHELVDPTSKTNQKMPLTSGKNPTPQLPETKIIRTQFQEHVPWMTSAREWNAEALKTAGFIEGLGQNYRHNIPTLLALQAVRRENGKLKEANEEFRAILAEKVVYQEGLPGTNPWRDCLLTEAWLLSGKQTSPPPKNLYRCLTSATRPKLDGILDDECWMSASPALMQNISGKMAESYGMQSGVNEADLEKQSYFKMRADDHFLYVAVQCVHPAGEMKSRVIDRRHDMPMNNNDRVSILLDLDRDYQTYFQLSVDQTGAVADDCWGDIKWNPKWYVAVQPLENKWTCEIAIPLTELTGATVTPGKLWSANVVRTIPGKGIQAWSGPAAAKPRPEGMGLLQFSSK